MSRQGRAIDLLLNFRDPSRAGDDEVALTDPLDVLASLNAIDPWFYDKTVAENDKLREGIQRLERERPYGPVELAAVKGNIEALAARVERLRQVAMAAEAGPESDYGKRALRAAHDALQPGDLSGAAALPAAEEDDPRSIEQIQMEHEPEEPDRG